MTKKMKKLYVEDVNFLKIQDTMLENTTDDLIEELDHVIALQKMISEDEDSLFDDKNENFENTAEKEKEYIQSLKSSIYSESFQRYLLKKVEQSKKYLESWATKYLDIILNMIESITETIAKSNMEKNNDNVFVALRTLLEGVIKEEEVIALEILNQIIAVLKENIEKIELINKEKREYIEITLKAKNGDDNSKNQVLEFMTKDIKRYAKKITAFNSSKSNGDDMLFDDLLQEWQIWVLRWIQKFSPKKSDNVKEYMKFWINQSMLSYITNKVHTIRLPAHVRQMYIKITKALDELTGNNIEQTTENIADHLWIDEDKVRIILDRGKMWNVMNMSDLMILSWKSNDNEISLDSMPFMEDKNEHLETSVLEKEKVVELQDTIKKILSKEEQTVIIHRYWLFWADQLLLKDLWEKLGKTEERIRQIENRALTMLSIRYFDTKYWKWFREIMASKNIGFWN